MHLYMGHIVSSLHILKIYVNPYLFCFYFGMLIFIFPHLLNFPQTIFPKNFFFFRGRKLFLKPMLFIEEVAFIFYRTYFFWVSLIVSHFSQSTLCMFSIYSLIKLSLAIHDKKGKRNWEVWETYSNVFNCFHLGGDEIFFLWGRKEIFLIYLN